MTEDYRNRLGSVLWKLVIPATKRIYPRFRANTVLQTTRSVMRNGGES